MKNLLLKDELLSYELETTLLDDFAIEMVRENSNLSCLLPMEYVSASNTVRYNTKGYVTLSHLLESPLDIKLVLSIFTQICEIVNYTRIHMLYENNLVIKLDNIFFDENTDSVKMVYVPTDRLYDRPNFRNFFKELMLDLETDDLQTSSSIFKKINKRPFELSQFLEFLRLTEKELFDMDTEDSKSIKAPEDNVISIEPIPLKVERVEQPFEKTLEEVSVKPTMSKTAETDERVIPISSFDDLVDEISFDDIDMEDAPMPVADNDEEDMLDIQHFLETNQDTGNSSYNTMISQISQLFTSDIKDNIHNDKVVTPKIIRMKDNSTMVINKKYFIIGASSHTDFTIVDNPQISRSHATIIDENGHYFISDNGSSNGTYINGKKIKQLDKVGLRHKDVITLASDEKLIFYLD